MIFDVLFPKKQEYKRVILQSPPQDYYLGALAAGAVFEFNVWEHTPNMRQFLPLNFVEIYNPSTTTLTCRVESRGGELFRIEPNSSRQLRVYFNNLIFTNAGVNALAANTAILTLQRI